MWQRARYLASTQILTYIIWALPVLGMKDFKEEWPLVFYYTHMDVLILC